MTIGGVTGATAGAPAQRCTAVPLDLTVPLAPGARGSVGFDVGIRVPDRPGRFGRRGRLALLSNAIPALAHREGGRWRLDRYFGAGETWTYPAADWTVRLDPPPGTQVAAPGVLGPDGVRRLAHGRDYSFAAGRLQSLAATIDGVRVTVWAAPDRSRAGLERVLRIARTRLPRLAARFGPYGWPDLQIVVTDDAAMEHTGLIMTPPQDFVVTHELAHVWWYALISDDQAKAPWLDEASPPTPRRRRARSGGRGAGARGAAPSSSRSRVDFFRGERLGAYGFVYSEGACLLDLLRKRIGRGPVRRRPARLRARAPARLVDGRRVPGGDGRGLAGPARPTSGAATACPDRGRSSHRRAC